MRARHDRVRAEAEARRDEIADVVRVVAATPDWSIYANEEASDD